MICEAKGRCREGPFLPPVNRLESVARDIDDILDPDWQLDRSLSRRASIVGSTCLS